MKLSVIMPVYNSEKYIEEAIKSILYQSFKQFELIIIDDGSKDRSIDIINSFKDSRIKIFLNEENRGLPFTRERGLNLATGKYIAFMDSDDLSYPNRFEEEIKILEKNKNIGFVSSYSDYIVDNKIIKNRSVFFRNKLKRYKNIKISSMFGNNIANSSAIIRREMIEKNNITYRKECKVAQDYAFWVDCLQKSDGYILNKKLIAYRISADSITQKSIRKNSNYRKKIIDDIRVRAIENNGFELSIDELRCICDIFSDPKISIKKEKYLKCINILKKMRSANKKNSKFRDSDLNEIFAFEINNKIISSNLNFTEKIELINKSKHLKIKIFSYFVLFYKELSERGK